MTTAYATSARPAGRGLVWLDRLLKLVTFLFALGTIAALTTLPGTLGTNPVGLDTTFDPPYAVTRSSGLSFETDHAGRVENPRHIFNGKRILVESSSLRVNVRVPAGDRDTRVTMSIGVAISITLVWVGLVALRRVVRSARAGDPFDRRNVGRLRRVALVALATPAVGWVVDRRLDRSVEWAFMPELRVDQAPIGIWPGVIVALAFVALAEVFREGADLRELEQSTI